MARYLAAAAIGILYLIASAWVVQTSGRMYRDALRRQRVAARKEAAPPPGEHPAAVAVRADSPPKTERPPPRPPAGEPPATKNEPLASNSPAAPAGKAGAMTAAATKAAPEPPDPASAWANALDLAKLSPADERRLGRELNAVVMRYNRPLETGTWAQRVEDAARPLLAKRSRTEIDYTFTVLDSEAVAAFSLPGGYVYVCRGLFNLIGEDEDYALEFVLGDEIAHVDLRHAIACVAAANAEEKKQGLGTLPQFYLLIGFGYPDAMEFEADAWVAKRMMVDLDRSRHDTLAFLRKFENYAGENGFANGRKLPPESSGKPGEPPPSLVENHFRSQAAARRRLGELKAFTETLKVPPR